MFDVNETLLDMTPLDALFDQHDLPGARREWFDLLIHSALTVTATAGYRDFAQLGAASARSVAQAHGMEFSEPAIAQLGSAMRALPAHPEVAGALAALRERGHRLVALANSPRHVVEAQLDHAGLRPLLDGSIRPSRPACSSRHQPPIASSCGPNGSSHGKR